MPTGAQLVAVAESQVGVTEKPRGSNRTKYGVAYGMNGQPWCAIFQWWVYDQLGINLKRVVTPGFASCEMGLAAFRGKRWTVAQSAALPGDLVYFQFDRDRSADHIGIIKSTVGGRLITVEGNTSAAGSQSNGGAVLVKSRNWSQVKGIGRVPGIGQSATTLTPVPPTVAVHPNPEARPVPPPPPPDEEEDDMAKSFILSDSRYWYVTDGKTRRYVWDGHQAKELVMLGQADNEVTSAGDVIVPVAPPGYLQSIPEESVQPPAGWKR